MVFSPNAQDEPRVPLARSPASAGGVTAVLVGSSAWFGIFLASTYVMSCLVRNGAHPAIFSMKMIQRHAIKIVATSILFVANA
jgi:hypothetical protein